MIGLASGAALAGFFAELPLYAEAILLTRAPR